MNDLKGKTALITGGTSGIGAACAKRFAQAGADVIITGRNIKKGNSIADDITENAGKCEFIYVDVSDDNSIRDLAQKFSEKYEKLDILFNNAGIFPVSPALEEFDRGICNAIFDVNISGMIMITKAFLSQIIDSKGTILNNASIAGFFASGQSYAYATSKSAVIQFTRMLAKRYGNTLRANCICPGVVETPLYQNFDEAKFASRIPMGRVGTPEDIAKAVNFLVSDDASYINGSVLTIDGGMTL